MIPCLGPSSTPSLPVSLVEKKTCREIPFPLTLRNPPDPKIMDGDRPTTAAAAASVRSVLGDDDLFREILLRLGFPNCLVRAALVSKRWLFHASDPAFLRLFRERHPPRLLGFCVSNDARYQFVQLEQSPELAALSRRVASSCNDAFRCRGSGI
uniref:F-box domain-containing protein n=2 Tax=Aegilops tauschii TaxID=37682 RepID=A0A453GI15_AEGTS